MPPLAHEVDEPPVEEDVDVVPLLLPLDDDVVEPPPLLLAVPPLEVEPPLDELAVLSDPPQAPAAMASRSVRVASRRVILVIALFV